MKSTQISGSVPQDLWIRTSYFFHLFFSFLHKSFVDVSPDCKANDT